MANKPNIRFKGFTDDWEQRKLGDIIKVCNGKDYKHLEIGKIPVYGTGGYMLSVSEALSYKDDSIGIGRKGTIDRPYILKAPFWTVDTLFYCIPKQNNDLKFIFSVFQNIDWKSMDESTGVPSLSKAAINKVNILTPNILEQVKIGTYFSTLDHLITLHQRKCDETKKLKKFMLQKMFPKNGEKNPEIRFAGFTDAWEQRKLGDIIKVCNGKDYKHLEIGKIPVYGTGGYMLSVSEALSYKDDSIGIGRKGTIDRPYILKAPFWTVDTLFYCIPKQNNDLKFIFSVFQNIDWKSMDESTGVPSLSKAAINKVNILTPNILEQVKIGTYFSTLDHLITLHQRKCDKLKLIKKFMLQNMFPKKG